MSLASCWELPGLASVLAEVEEPGRYKVESLGDWAYIYCHTLFMSLLLESLQKSLWKAE